MAFSAKILLVLCTDYYALLQPLMAFSTDVDQIYLLINLRQYKQTPMTLSGRFGPFSTRYKI
jgi:hypothetical protein